MQLFGKPLELVILDVDGVLLNLLLCFQKNLEEAAAVSALPLDPIRQYFTGVAEGSRHHHPGLTEAVRDWWPHLSMTEADAFMRCFRETERLNPYPAIEGSIETIRWFSERGVPLALCTTNSGARLPSRLLAGGVDPSWFAVAATSDHPHSKPDPRCLDPIFATVPASRNHAVYVGDWYPDLEAARGGGVRFVAVLSGGIPRHAFIREGVPDDHIIERLAELPKLIQE